MDFHRSYIVWRSTVVYTGSEVVAGEIEHSTVSSISVYEGIKCIFDLFGVETEIVLR